MNVIIYTNDRGLVSVFEAALGIKVDENLISRVVPKEFQGEAVIVDSGAVPADKTFRDAWVKSGSTVSVDLERAKEVAQGRRADTLALNLALLTIESERQAAISASAGVEESINEALSVAELKNILTVNSII